MIKPAWDKAEFNAVWLCFDVLQVGRLYPVWLICCFYNVCLSFEMDEYREQVFKPNPLFFPRADSVGTQSSCHKLSTSTHLGWRNIFANSYLNNSCAWSLQKLSNPHKEILGIQKRTFSSHVLESREESGGRLRVNYSVMGWSSFFIYLVRIKGTW